MNYLVRSSSDEMHHGPFALDEADRFAGMVSQTDKAKLFLDLHHQGGPLLMPNPWDEGSARLLASLGFAALATTSGGFAATLGRLDYHVTREEALASAARIAASVEVPVSVDLEDGYADDPAGVAVTVEGAVAAGLAGCSVEDFTRDRDAPIYDVDLAAARVEAAAEVAHRGPVRLVLTARAENYLNGRQDLADTITRLQRYQEAGADVLYAPGMTNLDEIRSVVDSVDRPVNVLAMRGGPPVADLEAAGVRRISVGGAFAYAALGAVVAAAQELRDRGTYGYLEQVKVGVTAARSAFG